MIEKILTPKYTLHTVVFHLLLGPIAVQNKFSVILWFYLVLLSVLPKLLNPQGRLNIQLNQVIVYLASFEILSRMARCTPYIPQEMSKYLLCFLFIFGILNGHNKGRIGIILILLITPALFIDLSGEVARNGLVFNLLGPIDLALGVIYFKGQHISQKQLMNLLKLALLPLMATLMYAVVKTPDYDDIDFALGSNAATSGKFGSNQVSTVFGLGMYIMFILWISGKVISTYRIVDAGILLLFVFQGFLTFSRGGILGAIVGVSTTLFILTLPGSRVKGTIKLTLPKLTLYALPIIVLGLIVFQVANDITGNNLLLRYKGETAGTLAGMKEVDINTITSNRYDIFMGDLELWQEHFILGVGGGASQYMRETLGGDDEITAAAHVELSRLLAEHGLLGLLFFILLLAFPFFIIRENQNPLNRAILLSLYVIALFSSFHAAMRTYVTPLFMSLSLISIRELLPQKIRKQEVDKKMELPETEPA